MIRIFVVSANYILKSSILKQEFKNIVTYKYKKYIFYSMNYLYYSRKIQSKNP